MIPLNSSVVSGVALSKIDGEVKMLLMKRVKGGFNMSLTHFSAADGLFNAINDSYSLRSLRFLVNKKAISIHFVNYYFLRLIELIKYVMFYK